MPLFAYIDSPEARLSGYRFVEGLIKAEESAGIPSDRVLVAGFSQGGAVSMLILRSSIRLAAVLGMSTWLPLADAQPILSSENKQTPVLMCHGNADTVVCFWLLLCWLLVVANLVSSGR